MSDENRLGQAAHSCLRSTKPTSPLVRFPPRVPRALWMKPMLCRKRSMHAWLSHMAQSAGYKIALTTPVMQQMVGVHEPVSGAILAKAMHQSPCTIRRADYGHLGVECEVAVRLEADLPAAQAPYSRDQVTAAIGAVMVAFELIDDRHADYAQFASQLLSAIADNAWNAGVVLGPPATEWRKVDLAAAHGTMVINGAVVGEGYGRDVMGHPLDALVWLANMLAQRGKRLSRGMVVMTGSIVTTKFVHPGDTVRFWVEGLGEVHLSVA